MHLCLTLREAGSVSLKDEVVNVGQCCSDTFQQQVERLNGRCLLSRVVTAGAQRQTEMKLKYKQKQTEMELKYKQTEMKLKYKYKQTEMELKYEDLRFLTTDN